VVYPSPLTLTVIGTGFCPQSQVAWNGTALVTTDISSTELTATIPASDFTSAGSAAITVINPAPGGGISNSLTFQVLAVPTTVDVNAAWAADPLGTVVRWIDGSTHTIGYDAFDSIQAGIDAVSAAGIVNVAAGTYSELILITKALTLAGA